MDEQTPRRFGVLELIAVVSVIGTLMVAYGRITDRIALMEADIAGLKKNELVGARLDAQRAELNKLDERLHVLEMEDRK